MASSGLSCPVPNSLPQWVLLKQVDNQTIANRTRSRAKASRAEVEWAGVANMLMGSGDDAVSLMGDGVDLIVEAISFSFKILVRTTSGECGVCTCRRYIDVKDVHQLSLGGLIGLLQ